MSFEKVRALLGQKNLQGYQLGLGKLTGTLVSFSPKEWNKKGKPLQQAVVRDELGETRKVKIYLGNGPEFQENDINTLQRFTNVRPNSFKGNMYYQAFWDSMTPPDASVPPQDASQSTNSPQGQNNPPTQDKFPMGVVGGETKNEYNEREDARQLMIVRQSSLDRAVEIYLASLAANETLVWPPEDDTITEICIQAGL